MRSPKKTRDALPPTAEGTTAAQQLSSCLAAAKGALSESNSQGRRFYRIREG
jgi:hypothetical protein